MAVDAGPAVKALPIPFKNGVLDSLIKLSAWIGSGYRELDGERIEFLCIADSFADAVRSVVRESQRVIRDDPDAQFVTACYDPFLLSAGYRFAPVSAQSLLIG